MIIELSKIETTEADVMAVRAVLAGTASADQQKRAMEWIAVSACGLFMPEFESGEKPLQSAHNSGRRYVGILIGQMLDPRVLAHVKAQANPKTKPRGTPK